MIPHDAGAERGTRTPTRRKQVVQVPAYLRQDDGHGRGLRLAIPGTLLVYWWHGKQENHRKGKILRSRKAEGHRPRLKSGLGAGCQRL